MPPACADQAGVNCGGGGRNVLAHSLATAGDRSGSGFVISIVDVIEVRKYVSPWMGGAVKLDPPPPVYPAHGRGLLAGHARRLLGVF
eukprot:scaffold48501_cov30-Tisochrysis_lutea.AAC.3